MGVILNFNCQLVPHLIDLAILHSPSELPILQRNRVAIRGSSFDIPECARCQHGDNNQRSQRYPPDIFPFRTT